MPSDNVLVRIFHLKNPYDEVATPLIDENKKPNETGADRLQQIFALDENGYQSSEMTTITQLSVTSGIGGFMIGGVLRSRVAYINFIESNQATQFINHLDAKRKLQREMYLAFMRGGWHLGWRIGMFSLMFSSVLTSVATYRGKDALMEYCIAGAMTGGLFRMNMGLKGMVAGSALGTALGTAGGVLSILALKLGGVSMQDLRDFTKLLHDTRENTVCANQQKYLAEEMKVAAKQAESDQQFLNLEVDEKPTEH